MIVFIKIDHIVDLITNSSSELFVIENKITKQTIVELLNSALKGYSKVSESNIEDRFFKEGDLYSQEYDIEETINKFPEDVRTEIKDKYFTNPKYWGISFDRDWIYQLDNNGFSLRDALFEIGFELIDTDY